MGIQKANNKAQIMIFVFFLMVIVGVFAGSLASMWQPEVLTSSYIRDGDNAFYLAQAGIERGKIELLTSWSYLGGGPHNYGDGSYIIGITTVSATVKRITSTGTVRSCVRTLSLDINSQGRPQPLQAAYCCWTVLYDCNVQTCAQDAEHCGTHQECYDDGCGTTCVDVANTCCWNVWTVNGCSREDCGRDAGRCGMEPATYLPDKVADTWQEK